MKRKIEHRERAVELRAIDTDDGPVIEGYAALFNSPSEDLGGFVEYIRKGAFEKTLREKPDVRALWNHDSAQVLGRTKSGTLEIHEDDVGLKVRIRPPEAATDRVESIRRGDVDGMSFGFRTIRDEWRHENDGTAERELIEVELFEVSPVSFPAYEGTGGKLTVRSYLESIGEDPQRIEEITGNRSASAPVQADHPDGSLDESAPVQADHPEGDEERADGADPELAEAELRLLLMEGNHEP